MSKDSMTESQRNQLAAEITGPGAFERHTAATIERLSGLVVELVRERSRVTTVKPPKIEVRNMKAELSAEPVNYADEFGAAEDMAKLRRELSEEQGRSECRAQMIETMGAEFETMKARRYEAAKKADEYRRERDKAHAKREKVAAQVEALKEEQEAIRAALGFAVLPQGGLPAAAALLASHRDALLEQVEAAKKRTQAFPWSEFDDYRSQVLDYRRRLGAVESALDAEAVVQDYTDRVVGEAASEARRDLSALCLLVSGGEHSSYVLASSRVSEMKSSLSALQDWQTSISAALECSPANAFDRVEAWKTALSDIQTESNEAPAQGEES